ncbi:MAG: hypothetical protein EXR69_15160 [Myxococcales bacterium]|nr:hypothetical protein [Myxococcales bacterium]
MRQLVVPAGAVGAARAALPDIGVELTDACSDDCETTTINAYICNSGAADEPIPITLELLRIDDGALLATEVIDDLASGCRRAVQLHEPSAAVGSGVRAVVTSPWAECQNAPNEAGPFCPAGDRAPQRPTQCSSRRARLISVSA